MLGGFDSNSFSTSAFSDASFLFERDERVGPTLGGSFGGWHKQPFKKPGKTEQQRRNEAILIILMQ
jgi:hypothetical protein